MTVTLPGGEPESRAFTLASATDAADLSELAAEARKDFFIEVYRLPPEEAKSLADWRRELAGRSKGGGNLVLTVSADACRLSGRPRDPVPITTYFAGKPGGGFTMLTRETDFVALAARMGRAAEIEACP